MYRAVLTRRCSVHRADQTSLKNDKRTSYVSHSVLQMRDVQPGWRRVLVQPHQAATVMACTERCLHQDKSKTTSKSTVFGVFSTDHFRDQKNFCEGSLQGYSVPCPIFDAKQRFGWWRYIPSSSSQKSPELVQDVLAVWDNLEQKLFSNMCIYIYI